MENKSCDGVLSKIKKIVKNPKSCKYIDKFVTIVDKHWNKGKHDLEPKVYCTRGTSISSVPSYQSTVLDTTSDDSGVILSQNNAPQLPRRKTIVTRAVIEPAQPKLWNSTPKVQHRISSPQYLEFISQTFRDTFQENSKDPSSDQSDRSSGSRGNGVEYNDPVLKESISLLKSTLNNEKIERNLARFRIYEEAILADATEKENSFERTASQRLIVNLFESRLSKRWKRKSVIAHSFDNEIQVINDETKEVTQEMPDVDENDILKSKTFCPMFEIYHKNVNTMQMQQSVILNSSFKSCGEIYITMGQIKENSFTIPHLPAESHLQTNVNLTLNADLELNSNISGFLTLGRKSNRHSMFWERKWCSLDANLFSIYNFPQDQEYGRPPVTTINLEYCFVPLVKHLKNFPRKNTFVLKTGRPSTINDSNSTAFRTRNNFVLEKYYFGADNIDDFERWTTELSSVLECLNDWERLVLVDDYYL
ncbi:hypothetical protein JTB14_028135 [Gonioctena quinquepunctata]|nr:hypothetical protein JTB14_028135 [Gonioctena quinquepunctata]